MTFGFRQRILSVATLLLMLSLGISVTLSYNYFSEDKKHSIDYSASVKVEAMTDAIGTWMENVKQSLVKTAPTFSQDFDDDTLVLLVQQITHASHVTDIVVGFEDGRSYGAASGKRDLASYDPRTRDWYRGAKSRRGTFVTGIYVDALTNQLMISVAEPFYRNGRLHGVLLADVTLDRLEALVSHNLDGSALASLYDAEGTVIASSSRLATPGKTRIHDIAELARHSHTILSNSYGSLSYESKNGPRIGYFDSIRVSDDVHWHYLVSVDEDEVYASLTNLFTNLMVVSVVLLLVSAGIIVFSLNLLFKPINALKTTIHGLTEGDGDLTKKLDVTSNDELGQIAHSINLFMEQLQALIQQTKQCSNAISDNMSDAVAGTDRAKQSIESQRMEVDQLAAAINQMSVSATEVASHSQNASVEIESAFNGINDSANLVQQSATSVGALAAKVDEASRVVSELDSASKTIASVLEVINDIADQTNLLALNAAIEAARAGESGRGFAVVADEVRSLAQKTQHSTEEIGKTISLLQAGSQSAIAVMNESQNEVESTQALAESADQALKTIRDSMGKMTDMIHQIASAAEEQSLVSEDINRNAQKTKDLSDEVSVVIEQTANMMTEQKSTVKRQHDVLSRFIV
ncbi:methyl-accepting chemotaxis protein [Thaumasiovibrio subtropicus]|uniref:methyl-accepting chemotaxis protein n=1 Tax=Thaumasiovibrio subtropicus TaxID=1891207 RepID=UPI000B35EC58|nr:methyl-accepting chemotaxis protein [Thaumasiovibrio subtropicus]